MTENVFQTFMQRIGEEVSGEEVVLFGEGTGFSFVAPVWAGYMMMFGTDTDIKEYNKDVGVENAITPNMIVPMGENWRELYWYATAEGRELANAAYKAISAPPRPNPQLMFFAGLKASETVNLSDEVLAKFPNDSVSSRAKVKTFLSKLYRHEYQLITLPMAVRAVAECYREELGIADDVELEFDISELNSLGAEVTDDYFQKLCGDITDKDGYLGSILYERREKLWAALGESDGTKSEPMGTKKACTDSQVLSIIFSFLADRWAKPRWARFAWVPNPKPDETYVSGSGDTKRKQLPGLVKLYKSELDARADVGTEGVSEDSLVTGPKVPAAWAGYEAEFMEEVARVKESVRGKPVPIQIRALAESEDLGLTAEEAKAWAG